MLTNNNVCMFISQRCYRHISGNDNHWTFMLYLRLLLFLQIQEKIWILVCWNTSVNSLSFPLFSFIFPSFLPSPSPRFLSLLPYFLSCFHSSFCALFPFWYSLHVIKSEKWLPTNSPNLSRETSSSTAWSPIYCNHITSMPFLIMCSHYDSYNFRFFFYAFWWCVINTHGITLPLSSI